MPTISEFYGVKIYIYNFDNKKHKMPHLHAISKDGSEVFNLNNCEAIEGYLPPRIHKKVKKMDRI